MSEAGRHPTTPDGTFLELVDQKLAWIRARSESTGPVYVFEDVADIDADPDLPHDPDPLTLATYLALPTADTYEARWQEVLMLVDRHWVNLRVAPMRDYPGVLALVEYFKAAEPCRKPFPIYVV